MSTNLYLMDNIKVVSLNVRGINNCMKRRKVFRYLKRNKADICFLQETFCSKEKEAIWASEWGNTCIFSNGQSNSCGVAILFKKKPLIEEIKRDMQGRQIHVRIKINEYTYSLSNIYAPNKDDPKFFESAFQDNIDLNGVHSVIGGDFNVVLDPKVDRNVNRVYHKSAQDFIQNWKNSNDFCDVWRSRNPERKVFTYMTARDKIAWSRIDYFLLSNSLVNNCIDTSIDASVCTDHSLISVNLSMDLCKRGPGIWKFNNSLLQDNTFVTDLKTLIRGCVRAYEYMRPKERWDLIKFEIKQFARDWAKDLASNSKGNKFKVYVKLNELQNELAASDDIDNSNCILSTITSLQNELDAFECLDAKRSAFRCKKTWIQGGEKMSKYYFNLEKRNFTSKTMYIVRRADGTLTKDYSEILNLQHDFYENLYLSNPDVRFNLQNNSGILLSNELREKLDSVISCDEIFDAMMTLKNGKCPGIDGLSVELYRSVWNEIKLPLYDYYMDALESGEFGETSRRGVINLIPKASSTDDFLLKNWRPIVLLNVDLKIWSKAIANRLEETTHLIGDQQTGFIKNRNIFTNILTTMEIVSFLNKKNKPGIIVTVDFSKCFDRVEFNSIEGAFKYFGFGNGFVKMMFLLFNNIKLCTSSNGYTSNYFTKCRGTNQGDPASPLIYCFCGEIMAHLIAQNPNIKGIDLHGIKKILSQFADDTAAYLSYELLSLENFTNTLTQVEAHLGLQVSYEKTNIYRIGSLYKSNAKLFTQNDFIWSDDPISLLGVKIPCNNAVCEDNLTKIMKKLHKTCDNWFNRKATLFGKITIVNALMGSLFVYCMSTMLFLKQDDINKIESIIRNFLWGGRRAKVSLATLMKRKKDGGLRLVNLQAKQQTMRIAWIFKLDYFLETCLCNNLSNIIGNQIWRCNIKMGDVKRIFGVDTFWSQMLYSWAGINFHKPDCKKAVLSQALWYNSHIKINGDMLCWKSWVEKGIFTVEDLVNPLPFTIKKTFSELGVNWLDLESVWNAIPKEWIAMLNKLAFGDFESLYDTLQKVEPGGRNRKIYDIIVSDENYILRYLNRWLEMGVIIERDKYKQYFDILFCCTSVPKYRDFQYRLLLGKITCNVHLVSWGIKAPDEKICTFCLREEETIVHLLFECEYVQPLLIFLRDLCLESKQQHDWNYVDFLMSDIGNTKEHILNFVSVFIKQYIYRCRCQIKKPMLFQCVKELMHLHCIEYAIARSDYSVHKHKKRWGPIMYFKESTQVD